MNVHRITGPARRASAVLWLLGMALSLPAAADGADDPFPITVQVRPALVVVLDGESAKAGRKVAISGRTLATGLASGRPVRIAIDSDDPVLHEQLSAGVGKNGAYASRRFGPVEPGQYRITATAPDGRGTATTTLTAIAVPDLGERASVALGEAIATVDRSLDEADRAIEAKPDSPARRESHQRLADVRKAHQAFGQADPVGAMRGFFGAIQGRDALLETLAPRLRETAATVAELEAQTARLERMQSELGTDDKTCEALAVTLEVAKAISTALGFEAKLTAQVAAMSKDVVADVASNRAKQAAGPLGGLGAGFLVKNGRKLATARRVIEGTKSANALMADFAAFATEQVFDAYCKRFAGPVEATFTGKFYRMVHGKRTLWWTQRYKLSGRLLLRYPRSASGPHIRMTGRLEGYAHSFHSWDNGMKAFDEKGIMNGTIVAKLRYPPLDIKGESGARAMSQGGGLLSAQVWGSAAGMVFPNSFAMKVRGELDHDSLSILIGKRITDFDAADKVVNVIVSPLNTTGPTVVWYPLPYVDAHSVFAGGTGEKPLRLDITTGTRAMTARGKAHHVENTEHARGEYDLSFRLCNPGC
jgi:hypothetical protein